LEATRRVTGIIALLNGATNHLDGLSSVSPDSLCPNAQFGLYATEPNPHIWNPQVSQAVAIKKVKSTDSSSPSRNVFLW
jgi:hypothetical protein